MPGKLPRLGAHVEYLGHFQGCLREGHNTIRGNARGSYDVYSESGRRMGKNLSRAGAHKRIGQIEYFKHHKG
jgi:hypothetical protein